MTADHPSPKPDAHLISEMLGYHFAALVSRNPQPCMSGDPRDRLLPHLRRQFDDACREAADAIVRQYAALADDPAPMIPSKGDAGDYEWPKYINKSMEWWDGWTNGEFDGRIAICHRFGLFDQSKPAPATGEDVARGLVEALEWYARPGTWMRGRAVRAIWGKGVLPGSTVEFDTHELKDDKGETARTALAAYRDRSTAAVREAAPPANAETHVRAIEEAAKIEAEAQRVYETWIDQPGYVPWVHDGNSDKQFEARHQARWNLRAAADQSRLDEGQQGGSDAG